MLHEFFQYLKEIISFLGSASLFLIAIVTFYKTTYCKKMKVSALHRLNNDNGTIINFKIVSCSLVSLIIINVELIIHDQWAIPLLRENDDAPIGLLPMGICSIGTKPYSDIKREHEMLEAFSCGDWYLRVTLSDRTVKKLKLKRASFLFKMRYRLSKELIWYYGPLSTITCYNDPSKLVVGPYVKYIVNMVAEGHSSFFKISDSGIMDKVIGGHDSLPRSVLKNKELVLEQLRTLDPNAEYEIDTIDDNKLIFF
jgi:hypothetical protein